MAYTDPFLLGPLGGMIELPSPPADGMDANYPRTQALHESLRGSTTVDVLGVHREWVFPWTWRNQTEANRIITRWSSPRFDALRLLDPLTPNLLSLDAAAGGASSGTAEAFSVSAGVLTFLAGGLLPGEAALLDGSLAWSVPATTVATLTVDPTLEMPVLGRAITARVWAAGNAGPAHLTIQPYNLAGAPLTPVVGSTVTLGPSTWSALTVTLPAGGSAVSASVLLVAESGSARNLFAGGFQAEHATSSGDWTPGGGCPEVVATDLSHSYRRLGRRELALTLREV